jgi:2-dehydro-3-deoxyphosphogluconate aldolase / (4S)-4-hydroxy-2-oxoglutarate aldolase
MSGESVLERLERSRIVPVVVIDDAAKAPEVAAALAAGGIHCAEITLRTAAGIASLAAIAGTPDFVLGAGTVLTPEQVDQCVDAGAEFIVSPGFDDDVVARAQERGVLALPGIATATEIQRALRAGLTEVKFFPADRLGGLATIAALAAPFPGLRFMPSGGVSPTNAVEYLAHPAIFAIGGSWMVSRQAIAAGDFDTLRRLSTEAISLVATVAA